MNPASVLKGWMGPLTPLSVAPTEPSPCGLPPRSLPACRPSCSARPAPSTARRPDVRAHSTRLRDTFAAYTPFEDVKFNPEVILDHDVKVVVPLPVADVFSRWARREYLSHVPFLESHGPVSGRPELHRHLLYYSYLTYPALELQWTEVRTEVQEGRLIRFKTHEGMPLMGEVAFRAMDGDAGTEVALHLEYMVPNVLDQYIGRLAIKTDVRRKLEAALEGFRNACIREGNGGK